MTKEEYFKTSDKLKLPRRCPLYNNCQRRVWSVFFNTYFQTSNKSGNLNASLTDMKNEGDLPENYEQNVISMVGEPPEIHKGADDYFMFKHFCPEVALFSSAHRPFIVPSLAVSSASYLKNNSKWTSEQEEYKHFSECQEFSKEHYTLKKNSKNKPRKTISNKTRFEVFQRDKFTCQFCKRTKDHDNISLEVDHIIAVANGGTDTIENLHTTCFDCNRGKSDKKL